jgi:hypothetical protein
MMRDRTFSTFASCKSTLGASLITFWTSFAFLCCVFVSSFLMFHHNYEVVGRESTAFVSGVSKVSLRGWDYLGGEVRREWTNQRGGTTAQKGEDSEAAIKIAVHLTRNKLPQGYYTRYSRKILLICIRTPQPKFSPTQH